MVDLVDDIINAQTRQKMSLADITKRKAEEAQMRGAARAEQIKLQQTLQRQLELEQNPVAPTQQPKNLGDIDKQFTLAANNIDKNLLRANDPNQRDEAIKEAQVNLGQQAAMLKAAEPATFAKKAKDTLNRIDKLDQAGDKQGAQALKEALAAEGKAKGVHIDIEAGEVFKELTKPEQSRAQEGIRKTQEQLEKALTVASAFDDNILTVQGRVKFGIAKALDFVGLSSDQQKDTIKNRTKLFQSVNQLFNQYRKEITGAAASTKELSQLKKAFINTDMSPTEFRAALGSFFDTVDRGLQAKQKLLLEGVTVQNVGKDKFVELIDQEIKNVPKRENQEGQQTLDDELRQLLGD